jgi:glycosyltransferase involved in cell wall biosynthesis
LYSPAGRVLVADDASDDDLRSTAAALEARHPERLRVLRGRTRRGTATNLNEAVEHVETPYFAKLDGDDVLIPGFLETAFPVIASRPSVGLVGGHELRIRADEVLEFTPEVLPVTRPSGKPRIMKETEAYRFILTWNPNPCSSGTIYRTEAFRKIGGYDPKIQWGEDWEIWLRFVHDWEVAYIDANSALYRIHQHSTTALEMSRNRLCYGYDAVFRKAAELCEYPEALPLLRKGFIGVAKAYVGAASREARHSRKRSLECCGRALRALSSAATVSANVPRKCASA